MKRNKHAHSNAEIRRLQHVVAVLGAVVLAFDYNDDAIDLSAVRVALGLVRRASKAWISRPRGSDMEPAKPFYIILGKYDNERPKGDHRHEDGRKGAYEFRGLEQLVADFLADVERTRMQS